MDVNRCAWTRRGRTSVCAGSDLVLHLTGGRVLVRSCFITQTHFFRICCNYRILLCVLNIYLFCNSLGSNRNNWVFELAYGTSNIISTYTLDHPLTFSNSLYSYFIYFILLPILLLFLPLLLILLLFHLLIFLLPSSSSYSYILGMTLNSSVVVLIMTLNLSGANKKMILWVWLQFAPPRLIFFV